MGKRPSWRKREEDMKEYLKNEGYDVVLRADGSHGIFDLAAFRTIHPAKPDLLVQVKTSDSGEIHVDPKEVNRLVETSKTLMQYQNAKMLFAWWYNDDDKRVIEMRDVTALKSGNKPIGYYADDRCFNNKRYRIV